MRVKTKATHLASLIENQFPTLRAPDKTQTSTVYYRLVKSLNAPLKMMI